ncbi:MAG: 3-deoxy-D-manno-octulosonic acid transferase [Bacteroidales bacterium]|nr:3-deoxy-D-manno-octulosonic acid transferase [Bacteroidales bacterium]
MILSFLYNMAMWLFAVGVRIAALFNPKARLFVGGRKQQFRRLREKIPADALIAWFHCASLGEFEQGRPLMEAYRRKYPQHKILLSFFSPSGYEVRKNYEGADYVCYLPVDTPRNARRFLKTVRPRVAVFIKYEFWHNYLYRLKKQQIPTYIVSAIFRPSQVFFKWYGGFFRNMLKVFSRLFVQDEVSANLLKKINIKQVEIAGDTRFDRVWAHTRQPTDLPILQAFTEKALTLVVGSSWASDEERLAEAMKVLPDNVQMIIAPHEVHEEHIAHIERLFEQYKPLRYTKTINTEKITLNSQLSILNSSRVLIIDAIGLLLSAYSYGQIAYVGGGFDADNGVHNTIEPAAYGLPVVFGPVYQKYAEAVDLAKNGGGKSVKDTAELIACLQEWTLDPEKRQRAGQISLAYVETSRGATERAIYYL